MNLRLALPSEGALFEGATQFMASCGLRVSRASSRRYTATVPALPGLEVLYQRQSDITSEIERRERRHRHRRARPVPGVAPRGRRHAAHTGRPGFRRCEPGASRP